MKAKEILQLGAVVFAFSVLALIVHDKWIAPKLA
jgi:hypothetical protein